MDSSKTCRPRLKLSWVMAMLGLWMANCGLAKRVFDPLDDNSGKIILVEPHFSLLLVGESVVLEAEVLGEESKGSDFGFSEDSNGTVIAVSPASPQSVLVTAVAPGSASVVAAIGDDEGLAVVTVLE